MNVIKIKISDLVPDSKNTRIHSRKNIEAVKASLLENEQYRPFVVQAGTNRICVGNCMYTAMMELGITEAWAEVRELTDKQFVRLSITDNRTSELGEWDENLLAEIKAEEIDLPGWDDLIPDELDTYDLADSDGEITEDTPPEPETEVISRLGDVWILGRHRLKCGDSTDKECVAKLMDGRLADMVFMDPPWNVNYGADQNHPSWKPRQIMNDFMGTEEFKQFMVSSFACMNSASKPGCMTYVVMGPQEWGNMMLALATNEYHWSSTIIWNKDHAVLSRKDYHTKYEPIWYGWKEGSARLCPLEDRKQNDVWDIDRPTRSEVHPTMKPIELVARAISNSSAEEDVCLDLFGGSGTTIIAAEQLNRRCYMMELDPKYVDVIIKRWQNITGEQAVHEETKQTFSEVERIRG